MALNSLKNPLSQLVPLPNVMNWVGIWSPTVQYYRNDVANSPLNNVSYILEGNDAVLGGLDPSLNAEWTCLTVPPIPPLPPLPIPPSPQIAQFTFGPCVPSPNPIPFGINVGDNPQGNLLVSPGGVVLTYMADPGPPVGDVKPTFLLDFNNIRILLGLPKASWAGTSTDDIRINLLDTVTVGGPYIYTFNNSVQQFPILIPPSAQTLYPIVATLGQLSFEVNLARAAGLRTINAIQIQNGTPTSAEFGAGGAVFATYFPDGVQ